MSSAHSNRRRRLARADRGDGVIPCGDGFMYSLGDRNMAALVPKSEALERRLRAIPGVRLVKAEPGLTNAILPAIRFVEVRGVLLAHSNPGRRPYQGPTVVLRRGELW